MRIFLSGKSSQPPINRRGSKGAFEKPTPTFANVAAERTGRWAPGPSLDGKGGLHVIEAEPCGDESKLGPPVPKGHAQKEQATHSDISISIGNIKDGLS